MSSVLLRHNHSDAWSEVVTDSVEDVRFNFVHDNLDNPTNYVSESSYSLKLPRCPENNRFFGHFGQLDSVIVAGGYDPTHKMEYTVLDSAGMLISTGDAVVTEINANYYVLSLVGSQARMFLRLLNAGYDTRRAAEDGTYYLLTDWLKRRKVGQLLVPAVNTINAAMVYASWRIDNPIFDFATLFGTADLKAAYGLSADSNITETAAFIASLVGFAPTAQGRYKDFESDKWVEVGEFKQSFPIIGNVDYRPISVYPTGFTYLPVLCSVRNFRNEPANPVDVGDGLLEMQLSEFRSYYQQPFVYISALWQLIRDAFPAITGGYSLQLDSRWFNGGNSDLRGLVYMLPQLYDHDSEVLNENAVSGSEDVAYGASGTTTDSPAHVLPEAIQVLEINNVAILYKGEKATFKGAVSLSSGLGMSLERPEICYYAPCNAIQVTVGMHRNGTYYQKFYIICPLPTDGMITKDEYWNSTELGLYKYISIGYEVVFPTYTPTAFADMQMSLMWNVQELLGSAFEDTADSEAQQIYAEFGAVNDYNMFLYVDEYFSFKYTAVPPKFALTIDGTVTTSKQTRTGSELSLERLFGDIKPAEVLMQYTKSRHMMWVVDDTASTVTVVRAQDYFADRAANITDLSNDVDKGREYKVLPLSWDTRRVLLNMEGIEADYIDDYAEKYGREYGSKDIVTANTLNDSDKKLLGDSAASTVKTSAMLSMVLLMRDSIINAKQDYKDMPAMPLNVLDGESADISGNFYYRHTNATWGTGADVDAKAPLVHITDDTHKEVLCDVYAWHGDDVYDVAYDASKPYLNIAVRPVFNTVSDGGLSVLFAPVREVYTPTPDQPAAYLYERCWQGYIEEVYNAQNKTLEVYVNITRRTFDAVRNSPFVRIGDMIYLLTSVQGWGEHNTVVRCALRQITDINKIKS